VISYQGDGMDGVGCGLESGMRSGPLSPARGGDGMVSTPGLGRENPSVRREGPGPSGAWCGTCAGLGATRVRTAPPGPVVRPSPGAEQTIYFCTVSGEAKRAVWPACARYAPAR